MQLHWEYADQVNEMAEAHLDTTPSSVHIHIPSYLSLH